MSYSEDYCSNNIFINDLEYGDLANIIYNNFEKLDDILPQLNILCFNLEKKFTHDNIEPSYININDNMKITNGCSVRISTISLGTQILYNKYKGLFSNLLTFMYFLVSYIVDKNKSLDESSKIDPKTFNPNTIDYNKNCIDYLYKHIPFEGKIKIDNNNYRILWYHPKKVINNTIKNHLLTGATESPHFFISSIFVNKINDIKNNDNIQKYIDRVNNNVIKSNTIPVKIYFNLSDENPAVTGHYEGDYILSPFIKSIHIEKITDLNNDKEIIINDLSLSPVYTSPVSTLPDSMSPVSTLPDSMSPVSTLPDSMSPVSTLPVSTLPDSTSPVSKKKRKRDGDGVNKIKLFKKKPIKKRRQTKKKQTKKRQQTKKRRQTKNRRQTKKKQTKKKQIKKRR